MPLRRFRMRFKRGFYLVLVYTRKSIERERRSKHNEQITLPENVVNTLFPEADFSV